jgi:Leucine-rich repeat (LRR) protein
VKDNELTSEAIVPIQLKETAEYIKDYKALKEIWEALDGKNWNYNGGTVDNTVHSKNWNFNKELDMWGNQPGVELDENGRITGLSLAGFGAKGRVPDAIGQLTELKTLAFGTHSEMLSGRLFGDEELTPDMDDAKKERIRMHYKRTFLDYDPRSHMSEMLQESINRDPDMKPIKKDNRITLKDTQIGTLTNRITFISKALMRLTKLQNLNIANSPILADAIATEWENENSEYAKQYADEDLSWSNLKDLTDIELYNCPKMDRVPDFIYELPEIQSLNLACNKGISAGQLKADWTKLAEEKTGPKIQILYLGYNNLEEFPPSESLGKMVKLGLLDCVHNNIHTVHAFGTKVKLTTLMLGNNQIEEIPDNFCAFTEQVEGLNFSNNKLKYIPNIFNAKSVYVMASVDFSYNEIGSVDGKNINCSMADYKGINASTVSLSNNQISKFPTELFATGSPIGTIDLSGNMMTSIPENSLKPKNGNYKNTHLLTVIDLRFNKLTSLSDDFRATTLPYLTNMDVSYNCFSKFPTQPLNSSQLKAFGIRHQRDKDGNRTLREWPTGITTCPSLLQLQIGSNDIRKVNETLTSRLYILEIADNPNISLDVTSVCPYIEAGMYVLLYDKTQDIRGCDALGIER